MYQKFGDGCNCSAWKTRKRKQVEDCSQNNYQFGTEASPFTLSFGLVAGTLEDVLPEIDFLRISGWVYLVLSRFFCEQNMVAGPFFVHFVSMDCYPGGYCSSNFATPKQAVLD